MQRKQLEDRAKTILRKIVTLFTFSPLAAVAILLALRVQDAHAFLVALVPGVGLLFDSAAMAWSYAVAIGLIGGTIALVTLGQPNTSDIPEATATGAVEVRLDPTQSPRTPPGWTPGTNGSDPIPPAAIDGASVTVYATGGASVRLKNTCLGPDWSTSVHSGPANSTTLIAAASEAALKVNGNSYCMEQLEEEVEPCAGASQYELCGTSTGDPLIYGDQMDWTSFVNDVSCPHGYTQSGNVCNLTDAALTYPPDGGCGIKKANGSWVKDSRDFDCNRYSNVTVTSRRATVDDLANSGAFAAIDLMDDGSVTVYESKDRGDGSSNLTKYRAGYDGTFVSAEQTIVPGTGASTIPSAPTGATGNGIGQGDGTGDGTGTGEGTGEETGTGNCGGPDQPACRMDDSGFIGANAGGDAAVAAGDAYADAIDGALNDAAQNPGYGVSWLPSLMPGTTQTCRPLVFDVHIQSGPLAGLGDTVEGDLCQYLALTQQILGWFFFAATAFYVTRRFFQANAGA